MSSAVQSDRIVSGMRTTGKLHLGHYHGVLKNWVRLQHAHECLYFVADWHALTTHYAAPQIIAASAWDMIIDWLAAGIEPSSAKIFIQSRVPEHAELNLLLAMLTPVSWLERVPTYKDQQQQLKDKDLATFGFLGYPLLQSADILIYKANRVPVGADQVAHIEITRELARRFNYFYGREPGYKEKAEIAIARLGKKNARAYRDLLKRYQEQGEQTALGIGRDLLNEQQHLSYSDRERLFGYLEGSGRIILPEPQALLTETAKVPGLDGRKMSKSYHNTINLRESAAVIEQKIKVMPTDPARVKRTDPGEPTQCPVWDLHAIYSDFAVKSWAAQGCRTASIGCLDCKKPLIDAVQAEQSILTTRAQPYIEQPELLKNIVDEGCEAARTIARKTLLEVRQVMGLSY